MKKFITIVVAVVTGALFSGIDSASNGELEQDILHGGSPVQSSPGVAYTGPGGTLIELQHDLISNPDQLANSNIVQPGRQFVSISDRATGDA